ncbi:hypothetical protein N7508_010905 [Penicillium antarcticum]|uniref:uncharacterized protein n=1 Tax=Penicillium antarcticum TaxID=416450 RepID=UPI0023A7319F|nr:uncharacterized protein N7508_010905 [Penicillium antarcticum]KAJ5296084.1 hypothetical protein N7508_010905 [Penicillium antarcticum]
MASAACIFCKIIKGMIIPSILSLLPSWIWRLRIRVAVDETSSTEVSDIPSFKVFESDKVFAFLDIQPLSRGHAVRIPLSPPHSLVIPKFHGAKLTDIPDEDLLEILPVAKKIAKASGATDFNILQNNGRIAHQVVDHVHFHMIPKPNEEEGMTIGWPTQATDMDKLKALHEEIKSKM